MADTDGESQIQRTPELGKSPRDQSLQGHNVADEETEAQTLRLINHRDRRDGQDTGTRAAAVHEARALSIVPANLQLSLMILAQQV